MLISNLIPKNFVFSSGLFNQDVLPGAHDSLSQTLSKPFKNKNTKKQNKNQLVKIEKDYSSVAQFRSANTRRLKRYTPAHKAVLDTIICNATMHLGCDISQGALLTILKNRYPGMKWYTTKLKAILRTLRNDKLIFVKMRYRDQSVYYPHSYFLDLKVKRKLRRFLPSLTEDKMFLGKEAIPVNLQFVTNRTKIIDSNLNIDQRRLGILIYPPLFKSGSGSGSVSRDDMRVRAKSALQQIVKKESTMTPMIKKVSGYLQLTQAGQVRLLAYPEKALAFADEKCKGGRSARQLDKPFFFFVKQCNDYCRQHGIELDEEKMRQTRMLLNISPAADFVDSTLPLPELPPEPQKKAVNTKAAWNYKIVPDPVYACPLKCIQPCRVDGKWSEEHKKIMANGRWLLSTAKNGKPNDMVPIPNEKVDEVISLWEAQFAPEVDILPF